MHVVTDLFVYGTLLPGDVRWPLLERYVTGEGTSDAVAGLLYDTGLDYPAVGPQHAYLADIGRAEYVAATDEEALNAFKLLASKEGIIPALESSHAIAYALKLAQRPEPQVLLVNLSGRGDKDLPHVSEVLANGTGAAHD